MGGRSHAWMAQGSTGVVITRDTDLACGKLWIRSGPRYQWGHDCRPGNVRGHPTVARALSGHQGRKRVRHGAEGLAGAARGARQGDSECRGIPADNPPGEVSREVGEESRPRSETVRVPSAYRDLS